MATPATYIQTYIRPRKQASKWNVDGCVGSYYGQRQGSGRRERSNGGRDSVGAKRAQRSAAHQRAAPVVAVGPLDATRYDTMWCDAMRRDAMRYATSSCFHHSAGAVCGCVWGTQGYAVWLPGTSGWQLVCPVWGKFGVVHCTDESQSVGGCTAWPTRAARGGGG